MDQAKNQVTPQPSATNGASTTVGSLSPNGLSTNGASVANGPSGLMVNGTSAIRYPSSFGFNVANRYPPVNNYSTNSTAIDLPLFNSSTVSTSTAPSPTSDTNTSSTKSKNFVHTNTVTADVDPNNIVDKGSRRQRKKTDIYNPSFSMTTTASSNDRSRAPRASRVQQAPPPPRNTAPLMPDNIQDETEFRTALASSSYPGSKEFVKVFKAGEHLHFLNRKVKVETWEDGNNFQTKLGAFDSVHLFEKKDGLDFSYPDDLSLDTVMDYIDPSTHINVIDSYRQKSKKWSMTMGNLLEAFNQPPTQRKTALNVLSLEFSKMEGLRETFQVPHFVRQHSLVDQLNEALKGKQRVLEGEKDSKEKKEKLAAIQKKLKEMPQYQRFLLLSMEDSFTDIHVDASATSVFYHVVKGRKVFYIANPTAENLAMYKKYELNEEDKPNEWIGEKLFKEFRRVEIREGQTAFIPSGYIHYVCTPEDSLVLGGNFLMEKHFELQFRMTAVEEESVEKERVSVDNLYQGFNNVIWAYVEELMLEKIREAEPGDDVVCHGKLLATLLDPTKEIEEDWFTTEQKMIILEKLKQALASKTPSVLSNHQVRRPSDESADCPIPSKRIHPSLPSTSSADVVEEEKNRLMPTPQASPEYVAEGGRDIDDADNDMEMDGGMFQYDDTMDFDGDRHMEMDGERNQFEDTTEDFGADIDPSHHVTPEKIATAVKEMAVTWDFREIIERAEGILSNPSLEKMRVDPTVLLLIEGMCSKAGRSCVSKEDLGGISLRVFLRLLVNCMATEVGEGSSNDLVEFIEKRMEEVGDNEMLLISDVRKYLSTLLRLIHESVKDPLVFL
ncbi:hypothetical protein CRE_23031 [Caenorhabditis remanei]|uniref:JmjC domain-containing protein n=1 Tax=Caenorhabditis remanei TaxID=31234 RepID=E3N4G3_CAERE|nr:hypothetical protein CRE_23031 [Caenorhabditis remanei]